VRRTSAAKISNKIAVCVACVAVRRLIPRSFLLSSFIQVEAEAEACSQKAIEFAAGGAQNRESYVR
jgi:hypothetical protein